MLLGEIQSKNTSSKAPRRTQKRERSYTHMHMESQFTRRINSIIRSKECPNTIPSHQIYQFPIQNGQAIFILRTTTNQTI